MSEAHPPFVLVPSSITERIDQLGSNWGYVDFILDEGEGLAMVSAYRNKERLKLSVWSDWMRQHFLSHQDPIPDAGFWYRADPSIHEYHDPLLRRGAALSSDDFRERVRGQWRFPPRGGATLTLALSGTGKSARWTCWWISRDQAQPGAMHIVDEGHGPFDFLAPAWPLEDLRDCVVSVIGCGSIGSAVADALVSYGVRNIVLFDPDRLQQHNLARHHLTARHLGRGKARALKDALAVRDATLNIAAFPLDIIRHADLARPLLKQSDVIVGATDGVASRRVINHLARRAEVPLILACVLEDGALGEVIRIRPSNGCLLCNRDELVEAGSLDPEPSLDLGYGTGTRHLPMTAVGGDLRLVGTLAAKLVIATILESQGHRSQRVPGEQAIIALKPVPDLPEPFDLEEAGEVRWRRAWGQRPDCPTCRAS